MDTNAHTPDKPSKKSSRSVTPRSSRGLRTLSIRVRDIVQEKGCTSYKEVADLMIDELDIRLMADFEKNEKNIRRRVYDALNVLISAGLVIKVKRMVSWAGERT